ncbi:MAG TPA: KEOPS complex subunit Pcc1 [Acidobacteriota bacterium]|nr:KEOPS complex subunit Pcc1 [Acidobacteriota bacterium]
MEAEIILEYDGARIAEAVAKAVSPDNFKTPKSLSIKTTWKNSKVITMIRCEAKLPTFISTVDDLLFCVATAEKALQVVKKFK